MADLMQGLLQGMQNPLTGMGIGILSGNGLGQGLQRGLMNSRLMQEQNYRQDLATRQMTQRVMEFRAQRAAQEQKQQQLQAISTMYPGVLPGMTVPGKMVQAQSMGLVPGTQPYNEFMQPAPNVVINQGETGMQALTPAQEQILQEGGGRYMDAKGNVKQAPSAPAGQTTAANYANRMVNSGQLMDAIDYDMSGIGGAAGALPRFMQPEQFQQVRQAQDDWIRAKLRKESGAVIGDEEMEAERQTYFPMPGDEDQVVLQKRVARHEATKGMIDEAGNAYTGADQQGQIHRTPEQPENAKPGDIWISPEGEFYMWEAD